MKSILTDSIYPMLLKKAFGRVGDLINHSWMEGQKVIMDEEFCPYGIKLGANQKEISRQRLKFNALHIVYANGYDVFANII